MNVRKPANYSAMYRELTEILARNLPQMDEIYAIGKAISQRPEKGAAVAAADEADFSNQGFILRGKLLFHLIDVGNAFFPNKALLGKCAVWAMLGAKPAFKAASGHFS